MRECPGGGTARHPRARAEILSNGTVAWARSFGDGYGSDPRMAHEIHSASGELIRIVKTRGSVTDGHELRELPNGNLLLDSYAPAGRIELRNVAAWKKRRPPDRGAVVYAEVQKSTPGTGGLAMELPSSHQARRDGPMVAQGARNPKANRFGATSIRFTSIDRAEWPDQIVISARHTDAIYGLDRSSGKIVSKLGGTATPKSLRVVGDPPQGCSAVRTTRASTRTVT